MTPPNSGSQWRATLYDSLGMIALLTALIALFSLRAPNFLSGNTLRIIANQIPDATLLAVGMTLVLLIGGIDLSVGSVVALSGSLIGVGLAQKSWGLPLALLASLGTGALCGALNGAVIVRFGLPSFIVTLGMLEAARGATYLVTNSQTLYIGSSIERIAELSFKGLSLPFLMAVGVVLSAHLFLQRTTTGRYFYAIGSNEEASRLSGIPVRKVKLLAFTLCGLLAGLSAILNTARLGSANPNAGIGKELEAIAAVVIGGTSLLGGRGTVVGSFFGVALISVLGNGLAQIGAQEATKRLITGLVIVLAVLLDLYRTRLRARSATS